MGDEVVSQESQEEVVQEPQKQTWHHPNQFRNALEEQLNKWANSISTEYRIPPNTFHINLVNPIPGHYPIIARVQNGAVVQIHLTLPWTDKTKDLQSALLKSISAMKSTVRRLFKYISSPQLHNDDEMFNPLILSNKVHEYVKGEKGTRTWRRTISDPHDFSGFKRRDFKVVIEREIRVTVTHKDTKMSYSIVDKNDRPEYDLIRESLEKCIEIMEVHNQEDEDG